MDTGSARLDALHARLRQIGSAVVGYSGGVDSAFLARTAVAVLGPARVLAVTAVGPAYPAVQRDMARRCAREHGIPHMEVETREIDDPRYAANPANRCYYCKAELWSVLLRLAQQRGIAAVLEGSNADDAADWRPGLAAARERGVLSPLMDAGLTKAEIRLLSRDAGLPTWDQPAAPCLASRIAYGVPVTRERLGQVERAEASLRAAGFVEFRVRHHGNAVRVEVAGRELARALGHADALGEAVRAAGFRRVLLDVEGYRRGALNEGLPLIPPGGIA
jgi:pyridinium-3,5-biscarboxylic acid mononucleotide sulfurtransferase